MSFDLNICLESIAEIVKEVYLFSYTQSFNTYVLNDKVATRIGVKEIRNLRILAKSNCVHFTLLQFLC